MNEDTIMRASIPSSRLRWLAVATALIAGLSPATGCANGNGDGDRFIGPGVIEIRLPAHYGELRRPAVEFGHAEHAESLAEEGCEACHEIDHEHGVIPKFGRLSDPEQRDALMNLYHDQCLDCHRSRGDAGPVTCGECHVRRPAAISSRVAMRFDYSLHQRHVLATTEDGKENCEKCHHTYDERAGELIRERGTEDKCDSSGCHGETDVGNNLSMRNAAHRDCIRCHFALRAENVEAERGPIECVGCHDEKAQAEYETLNDPPRLTRDGMPELVWLQAPGAETNLVAFDHRVHERVGDFCSTCHHDSMKACQECHTLAGSPDGDHVTLEQAYHRASSEHSCVGCHAEEAQKRECVGCHHSLPRPPTERSCELCHNGPAAGTHRDDIPPAPVELRDEPLPPTSEEEFPATIAIDGLARDYGPSELPHRRIVEKLDQAIRQSKLARRFHVSGRVLCSGCHHQSPLGARPPPCKACHDRTADATADRPGLKAAYHRQCIGCHRQMRLEKQGCEDCHERAGKEVEQ